MDKLHALAWPVTRLGELLEAVARHRGLPLSGRYMVSDWPLYIDLLFSSVSLP